MADAKSVFGSAHARVLAPAPAWFGGFPGECGVDRGGAGALIERGIRLRALWMWGWDGDRQAAYRRVVSAAVGAKTMPAVVPSIRAEAATLLAPSEGDGDINLVQRFAEPLIRNTLMDLLGVPPAMRLALDSYLRAMGGFVPGAEPSSATYFALAAVAQLLEEVWSRDLPAGAGGARAFLEAVERGDLSSDEALAQASLMLFGNSYTTIDVLSGLLARMAERPVLWQKAREGVVSVAALVEESLRVGPPFHVVLYRRAARNIPCPGGSIPEGSLIVLPLNRINRDPSAFSLADEFNPERTGPPHLAFGAGTHTCAGLHLARGIMQVGMETLLRRLSEWPRETEAAVGPGALGAMTIASLRIPAAALLQC